MPPIRLSFGLMYGVLLPTLRYDPQATGLGRALDAAFLDGRELRFDGDRQSGFAKGSGLALVHRVAVHFRNRRRADGRAGGSAFLVSVAGTLGGIVGGLVDADSRSSLGPVDWSWIWYPVNLLAAMVERDIGQQPLEQLSCFTAIGLSLPWCCTLGMSVGFGIVYGLRLPEIAGDSRPNVLGGHADAHAMDGSQLWIDGGRQPCPSAAGRLALVYRLAVRLRVGGGDRRRSFGNDPRAAGRSWPGIAAGRVMMCRGSVIGGDCPQAYRSRRVAERSLLGLAALVVALLSGCDFPGKPNPADRPVPPEKVLEFATLFKTNCAGCHGTDGNLVPHLPSTIRYSARLCRRRNWNALSSAGRPGTPMPAFALANGGTLTAAQIRVLVYEIKGIHYRLADVAEGKESERQPATMPLGSRRNGESPERWRRIRLRICRPNPRRFERRRLRADPQHGLRAGLCRMSRGVRRRRGSRPHQRSFISSTYERPGLRRLIITGRPDLGILTGQPDLGMPDYAGTNGRDSDFKRLTSDEINELVDLLASWRTGHSR